MGMTCQGHSQLLTTATTITGRINLIARKPKMAVYTLLAVLLIAAVIVLVSDFYVAPDGGNGSLNQDSTYTDWKWILVRNKGGEWKHLTHGYA